MVASRNTTTKKVAALTAVLLLQGANGSSSSYLRRREMKGGKDAAQIAADPMIDEGDMAAQMPADSSMSDQMPGMAVMGENKVVELMEEEVPAAEPSLFGNGIALEAAPAVEEEDPNLVAAMAVQGPTSTPPASTTGAASDAGTGATTGAPSTTVVGMSTTTAAPTTTGDMANTGATDTTSEGTTNPTDMMTVASGGSTNSTQMTTATSEGDTTEQPTSTTVVVTTPPPVANGLTDVSPRIVSLGVEPTTAVPATPQDPSTAPVYTEEPVDSMAATAQALAVVTGPTVTAAVMDVTADPTATADDMDAMTDPTATLAVIDATTDPTATADDMDAMTDPTATLAVIDATTDPTATKDPMTATEAAMTATADPNAAFTADSLAVDTTPDAKMMDSELAMTSGMEETNSTTMVEVGMGAKETKKGGPKDMENTEGDEEVENKGGPGKKNNDVDENGDYVVDEDGDYDVDEDGEVNEDGEYDETSAKAEKEAAREAAKEAKEAKQDNGKVDKEVKKGLFDAVEGDKKANIQLINEQEYAEEGEQTATARTADFAAVQGATPDSSSSPIVRASVVVSIVVVATGMLMQAL